MLVVACSVRGSDQEKGKKRNPSPGPGHDPFEQYALISIMCPPPHIRIKPRLDIDTLLRSWGYVAELSVAPC